jgi:hypothetical protein
MLTPYAYIQQRNASNRKARQFLHDLLANGPQTYAMIQQHAREAGVALSFLMAAKRSLHVQSHKSDGYAVWHLPAAA